MICHIHVAINWFSVSVGGNFLFLFFSVKKTLQFLATIENFRSVYWVSQSVTDTNGWRVCDVYWHISNDRFITRTQQPSALSSVRINYEFNYICIEYRQRRTLHDWMTHSCHSCGIISFRACKQNWHANDMLGNPSFWNAFSF